MRTILLAIAPLALIGAVEPETTSSGEIAFDNPAYSSPPRPWTATPDPDADGDSGRKCADIIREAREDAGLPQMERRAAAAEIAEMIWAVDHRRDGCGVLVMRGQPQDIRPVPQPTEDTGLMPVVGNSPR